LTSWRSAVRVSYIPSILMAQIDSTSRHQTGALFLAAALSEMFPKVSLSSGGGTDLFFFCDCAHPFVLQPAMIPLLEERLRLFLKKTGEIAVSEMMTANAIQYFASEGRQEMVESLQEVQSATVVLYRVEGSLFYLPLPDSFTPLRKGEMTSHLRLLLQEDVCRDGRYFTRLIGVWTEDKEELKKRVKASEGVSFHEAIAQRLSLACLISSGLLWRENGVAYRAALTSFLKEGLAQRKISTLSCSPCIGLDGGEKGVVKFYLETLANLPEKRVKAFFFLNEEGEQEGFLSPRISTCDRSAILCSGEDFFEEMISSLQFILQIPKILHFEYELVITVSSSAPKKVRSEALAACEKTLGMTRESWRVEKVNQLPYLARIEVRVRDALGRSWLGPFIGLSQTGAGVGWVIFISLCYSLERMIALFLEREQKMASLEGLMKKLKSKQE